jgi:O-antigen ligase
MAAAVPLLPVLACILGGATQKWAEGIIVALLGVLLLVNPPRHSLGVAFNSTIVALVACAATAFLPARWFFQPAWRQALVNDFAVNTGPMLSPQPWISLGCLLSFFAGLSWLYYVATQDLDPRTVRQQLRVFAAAVAALAASCVILYVARTALPFWHNQRGFGPFPNRNQTGDLLGISAVVILACGQDDIRQGRKRWLFWLAALAVVITAIVLNFSRAGIAILVAGTGLWLASFALRRGSGARLALGASALLALLTVMLLFGGQTLERFHFRGDGAGVTSDFRWLIFHDVWQLIRASPLFGIGLGNFEPVFATFRDASLGQSKALHPESDWLWIWSEMGWPSVALIVGGAALLLWRVFPMSEGTNQRFRLAALLGALLFGIHGIVDVSAHRVGSAYAGLLLLGLALRRPLELRRSAVAALTFRGLGVLLVGVGATWTYAAAQHIALPGGIGVDLARRAAMDDNQQRRFADTITDADGGLQWAPLDWQLYFLRGLGKVGADRNPADALDDFRRARFLEPNAFEVPYQEGLAWVTRQPTLAITAWREALRRAGPQRADLYGRILSAASGASPAVARTLEEFAAGQHDLAIAFLERLNGPQFMPALRRLLERDPDLQTLTRAERVRLFDLWAERGDADELAAFIEAHPDDGAIAWRGVAKSRAAKRDFRGAYDLAQQFGTKPALPQPETDSSIEELERAFYATPSNYAVGFALYEAQMRAGKLDDALNTLRHFTDDASAPAYFRYLEAEAWAAKGDWERAWLARQQFESARK